MAISVSCNCGQKYETGEEFAGRRVKCPDCGRVLVIRRPVAAKQFAAVVLTPVNEYAAELSTRSIISAMLGVLSFLCVFLAGIPAIIYGGLAISEINQSQGRLKGKWLAVVGILCGMLGSSTVSLMVMVPMLRLAREEQSQVQCRENLRKIGQAIHSFQIERSRFPAAAITDRKGKPLLSWRVAILPFLGEEGRKLYEQFNLDEPWDSTHNLSLIHQMPPVFACPDEATYPSGQTVYQVIIGPSTMFTGARQGFKMDEISDGTSMTIMVAEAASAVTWTAPDEASVTSRAPLWGLGSKHPGSFNTLFADGSVHFLPDSITPKELSDLTTIRGGENVTPPY